MKTPRPGDTVNRIAVLDLVRRCGPGRGILPAAVRLGALPSLPSLLALLLATAPAVHAQDNARFMRDCAEWVAKKGYSVDYIDQRTGERPAGNLARDWRANLDPKDVQAGDVVFVHVDSVDGKGQRAEVVDEVLRLADGSISGFRTSSMNIGKMVEPQCHVTENFGKVSRRRVGFDRVQGAWRPDKK